MTDLEIDLIALGDHNVELTERIVREIKLRTPGDTIGFLDATGRVSYAATYSEQPVGWAYGYILDRPDGRTHEAPPPSLVVERQNSGARESGSPARRYDFEEHPVDAGCQTMWLIIRRRQLSMPRSRSSQLQRAWIEGSRLQFAWRRSDRPR